MATHTLGPWSCERPIIRGMHASISNCGNINVAHIDNVNGFSGDSDANARLIAAAPEMYEALKVVLDAPDMESLRVACDIARAALARAEGRE